MATVACGLLAIRMHGGLGEFYASLPKVQYMNLFARGFGTDFGVGLNVALGVISTQTYIQAALAGRSNAEAVKGCLFAATLTPPIGFFSLFVGMYMHIYFPQIAAAEAFPTFILHFLPGPLAGVALATLLIAVVGTGSGMALGFGTIISNDIYKKFINRQADGKQLLLVSRLIILLTLISSATFTLGNLGTAILSWGSMSMGLRAVVLLAPMTTALFLPGRVRPALAVASSVLGVVVMLAARLLNLPFDSLFIGLLAAALILLLDLALPKDKTA